MFRCLKYCCKNKRKQKQKQKQKQTYVLELEDGKYYVGESNNVVKRIWVHENGNGCSWTKKYNFINELKPLTQQQPYFTELVETLRLIEKYGIENVRGSMFTSPYPLSFNDKVIAAQLYCELNNLCRKCGSNDHFITQCKSDKMATWVQKFGGNLSFDENILPKGRNCLECNSDISNLQNNYRYCRECYRKIYFK